MTDTRRGLLRAVGTTLVASAIAGCSSAPQEGDGGGEGNGDAADDSFRSAYRTALAEDLDVEITAVTVADETVSLRYTTSNETDTEGFGYEVGFVSARFGRIVDDGWDVEELSVRATTADDRTVSWTVNAETALAYVNDEITVEEFIDRVSETMTVE